MLKFMNEFRKKSGITVGELDLGGGFGVKYVENESGVYLTPRFSPGYGDFSLQAQKPNG